MADFRLLGKGLKALSVKETAAEQKAAARGAAATEKARAKAAADAEKARAKAAADAEKARAKAKADKEKARAKAKEQAARAKAAAQAAAARKEQQAAARRAATEQRRLTGSPTFAAVREGEAPARATAQTRIPLRETTPALPSSVTGSYDATRNEPVTFRGKQPWELTSNEMADFGDALGVPNIGPLNDPKTFRYTTGEEFQIPGGLNDNFTYEDMLWMKSRGINPDQIDPSLHRDIQAKLMRSMKEPEGLSDARVMQGLTFGMTSPNQPLFPNQLAMSRFRPVSREQMQQVVAMRPWDLNDPVTAEQRAAVRRELAKAYGINAAERGGLGVSGSVDYSRFADLNDMFLRDPAFFHRGQGEDWTDFVQRINSQVPGLGNKTTSFGVAWQPDAAVSAIDRHMVNKYADTLLADPARRAAFQDRVLRLARARAGGKGGALPETFEDVNDGIVQEVLLSEVGESPSMNLFTAKGELNPNLPPSLAVLNETAPPEKVELMGDDYKSIIAANEAASQGSGLHLFGNQWNVWDRIRRRLEPHENMFPGLELIPRMSPEQLRVIDRQHMLSGHKNYTKEMVDGDPRLQPTKPVPHERMRHFSRGGLAVRKPRSLRVARR